MVLARCRHGEDKQPRPDVTDDPRRPQLDFEVPADTEWLHETEGFLTANVPCPECGATVNVMIQDSEAV